MSFIWPAMLWLLLMVPLCVGLYLRLGTRRRLLAARYGSTGMVQRALGRELGARRHFPPTLFLLSLTILIIALARPQAEVGLPGLEGTVMLAFDVSASMAANDLEPNRMEAAKAAARDFVLRQPASVQVGVVAFSNGGLAVQAPTKDQAAVLAAINRLEPQRGTSVAHGILASLKVIAGDAEAASEPGDEQPTAILPTPTPVPEGTYAPAAIVLFSDGENTQEPDPLLAARAAADRGVRIYSVGIGSTAGTTLQLEGFTVHTRLDETMLRQIALLTDGAYFSVEDQAGLRAAYDQLRAHLVRCWQSTAIHLTVRH